VPLLVILMSDEMPTADEIERERSLERIFGCYAAYRKSLHCRTWERTKHGWVSRQR
jgi:hypothetical protein